MYICISWVNLRDTKKGTNTHKHPLKYLCIVNALLIHIKLHTISISMVTFASHLCQGNFKDIAAYII